MIEFQAWDYEIVRQYAEQTGQRMLDALNGARKGEPLVTTSIDLSGAIRKEDRIAELERENAALNATIDNIVSIIGKGDDIDLLAEIRSMKAMSDALKALAGQ